ncbi:MAG: TRAP transporter small permease [Deferrisomatales bacterium]
MSTLEKLSALVNRALACAAGCGLVAMMAVTVADMGLRLAGRPLAGSYEIIGWLAAVTAGLSLGYTQHHRGHVAIDLVTERLGPAAQAWLRTVVSRVSTALFLAVAWHLFRYAGGLRASGSLSETLKVAVYPWVYLVALGGAGLALALLADLLGGLAGLRPARRGGG